MERREIPYVRPAGQQANATQEAFARARSVWPRRDSTTGPNRGRTSPAEVARGCPKPTCAGPPGRARACRVLCGPLGLSLLPLSLSSRRSAVPLLSPPRASPLFTTLLDARSLRRGYTCAPLSFSFPRRLSLLHLTRSPSTPSHASARAAKMRWFRGREAGC